MTSNRPRPRCLRRAGRSASRTSLSPAKPMAARAVAPKAPAALLAPPRRTSRRCARRACSIASRPSPAGCRTARGIEALAFGQPRHQFDEVAGAKAVIELIAEKTNPSILDRAGRSGERENVGPASDAGAGARLDRRGADRLVALPAEQLAEAGDHLLGDRLDRLRGDVAPGYAGAACGKEDVDIGVGDPRCEAYDDGVEIVTLARSGGQHLAGDGQASDQRVA